MNVRNIYITSEVFKEIQKITMALNNHIDKAVLVGITSIQQIFIRILGNLTHIQFEMFSSGEEANDWLMKDKGD